MQKRGQVTAFVIVGIVIILIIGLLFFMKDYYGVGVDPKVHIQGPLNSIKDEVSECVDSVVTPELNLIAKQGGDSNPSKFRLYDSRKVKYLCQNIPGEKKCLNSMDPLSKIEENLEKSLQNKLSTCVSKDLLKSKRGYTVRHSNPNINVKVLQETVLVEIDYPVEISKDGVTQKLSTIKREIPDSPLGSLYTVANDITNELAKTGYFYHLPYMLNKKGRIIIQVDKPYPDVIYKINKKDSNFQFVFAIEGEE